MLIPVFLLMFLILTNKDSFQKHFSQEVLDKLSIANNYMGKTTRNILFFISLILMTLALSRPVINEREHSFTQEVSSIVVAIDISKSMLANDIYPNRLTMAKQKLLNIIELSKKNAIAVVLFAKSSFILSPVTQDFNSLKILVENLNSGMNFDNGSNIFSTLETTNKLLKDYDNKNLILLTDGGNNDTYLEEIDYANENKINIYTIATATKNASPIKLENGEFLTDIDGSIVTVSLNENIKNLSLNTNGGYINYSISNDDVKQILADIDTKSSKKQLESKKFKTYTELFYYPLALAIFLLLIAFSSLPKFITNKLSNSFIICITLFFTNNAKAIEFDFQTIDKANEAYKNKEYEKASKSYDKVAKTPEARYNLANSLYKENKYKEALSTYRNITTSNKDLEYKKLHNMGNSYVKLNDLENAKKMYENALKIKGDKQTRENLETVQKILDEKKKQQEKEQNKDNKDQKNNKDKEEKNKNKKNNQEKQKEKEDKKQEKEQNNSKNQEDKQKKQNQQTKQSTQQQKIKPQEISDLEEKKWLNKLQNKKTPVLLKKVETQKEDTTISPW